MSPMGLSPSPRTTLVHGLLGTIDRSVSDCRCSTDSTQAPGFSHGVSGRPRTSLVAIPPGPAPITTVSRSFTLRSFVAMTHRRPWPSQTHVPIGVGSPRSGTRRFAEALPCLRTGLPRTGNPLGMAVTYLPPNDALLGEQEYRAWYTRWVISLEREAPFGYLD